MSNYIKIENKKIVKLALEKTADCFLISLFQVLIVSHTIFETDTPRKRQRFRGLFLSAEFALSDLKHDRRMLLFCLQFFD